MSRLGGKAIVAAIAAVWGRRGLRRSRGAAVWCRRGVSRRGLDGATREEQEGGRREGKLSHRSD
jgi:hypothetical protein